MQIKFSGKILQIQLIFILKIKHLEYLPHRTNMKLPQQILLPVILTNLIHLNKFLTQNITRNTLSLIFAHKLIFLITNIHDSFMVVLINAIEFADSFDYLFAVGRSYL